MGRHSGVTFSAPSHESMVRILWNIIESRDFTAIFQHYLLHCLIIIYIGQCVGIHRERAIYRDIVGRHSALRQAFPAGEGVAFLLRSGYWSDFRAIFHRDGLVITAIHLIYNIVLLCRELGSKGDVILHIDGARIDIAVIRPLHKLVTFAWHRGDSDVRAFLRLAISDTFHGDSALFSG